MGKSIIFSAPSGAGKTTIIGELLKKPELKLEFSISATSRNPRNAEVNAKDYYFLSKEDFLQKIDKNEFVEWEEVYNGSYYGTLKQELERIWSKGKLVAFDVDVKGGLNLKRIFKNDALLVFVMPPSVEELERRLRGRGTESEETLKTRIDKAKYEISYAEQFDVIITNDVLEQSVEKARETIEKFLNSERNNGC